MTIRILLLALLTVMLGASPPSTISTQRRPESFFTPQEPDPPQKHPDVAFEAAMRARLERFRVKSQKKQVSLAESLVSKPEKDVESAEKEPEPVKKSSWKQRKPPEPKKQVQRTHFATREIISPALRGAMTGTRRFCYGKCGR